MLKAERLKLHTVFVRSFFFLRLPCTIVIALPVEQYLQFIQTTRLVVDRPGFDSLAESERKT